MTPGALLAKSAAALAPTPAEEARLRKGLCCLDVQGTGGTAQKPEARMLLVPEVQPPWGSRWFILMNQHVVVYLNEQNVRVKLVATWRSRVLTTGL